LKFSVLGDHDAGGQDVPRSGLLTEIEAIDDDDIVITSCSIAEQG
jgi:hypothetical protein